MPKDIKSLISQNRAYTSDCKGYIHISKDRAKEWTEINLEAEDYMKIFGKVDE
ncbi:hypothetical protein [Anaerococcus prevotii]|uniref:hypothetical protein n=1 Tax=Anaerococcus prevotii TaxID=33034 RepID=UPI00019DD2A5|nr:hypothetical protein [Anaerococcus prevotii]